MRRLRTATISQHSGACLRGTVAASCAYGLAVARRSPRRILVRRSLVLAGYGPGVDPVGAVRGEIVYARGGRREAAHWHPPFVSVYGSRRVVPVLYVALAGCMKPGE